MQRMQPLVNRFILIGSFFAAQSLSSSYAMTDGCHQELPAIVKGYQEPRNLEKSFLTILRDKTTQTELFRGTVKRLVPFLANCVSECLDYKNILIQTPVVDEYTGIQLANKIMFVPVLRSGEALLEVFREYLSDTSVRHILVQRDEETAQAYFLYSKLPACIPADYKIIILEPMIATGGSLEIVINKLKAKGASESNIIVASVVAAPEGLHKLAELFPDICVTVLAIDAGLNDRKYIVPGLGDFGDRYYGTEEKLED